jgi:uncharacterized protein
MSCRSAEETPGQHVPHTSVNYNTARLIGFCTASLVASRACSVIKLRILALSTIMAFSGCSVLAPKPDRTRFILLTSASPGSSNSGESAAGPALTSTAIGLGPVQLPGYLDRPELLIRTSPNGLELSEKDRWAETLADNFRHVLANDLTNLLGTTNIIQYPWYPGTKLDYIVHVQVQRFEADTNRTAELMARWDLRTPQTDQVLASREVHFTRPLTSLTGDAAAAGLSQDVAELASQIGATIMHAEQQRVARGPH